MCSEKNFELVESLGADSTIDYHTQDFTQGGHKYNVVFDAVGKIKISALWVAIMLLYIYNDFFSLFKPDALHHIIDGYMGPFPVTQASLFSAAILMAIPATMIFLSVTLKAKLNRILNIIFGFTYIAVMIVSITGEWNFYIFMGVVEIILTSIIVYLSIKWPKIVTQI